MGLIAALFPGRLYVYLALLAGAFASGGVVAWKVQNWRQAEQEVQRVQLQLENQRLVAATRTRQAQAVIAAQNEGQIRAARMRVVVDAVRAANDGLRDEIATTVRDASISLDACAQRAAALGELLGTATESHRLLAEKADRHTSDIRTLIAACPH